jgi:hypothetical protein
VKKNPDVSNVDVAASFQAAGYAPGFFQMTRGNGSGGATPDNSIIGGVRFDGRDTTNAYALFGAIEVSTGVNASGGAPAFMAFYTSPSGASVTERMRIDAAGNVGIGTSAPSKPLSLSSSAGDPFSIVNTNSANFNRAIFQKPSRTWSVGQDSGAGFGVYDETAVAARFTIDSSGRALFGTGSPDASSALDVTSTIGGVLFPRMTGTQRDAISSPANGLVLYNTTTNKLQVRAAGAWVDLH